MTPAGWYPDPTIPGTLRWWDGAAWTEHRAPVPAPASPQPQHAPPVCGAPPAPMPKLRPDGTVRGPSFRSSLLVLLAGLAAVAVSLGVLVPGLLDAVSGPRFDIPGEETLDLDTGTWVLYERVGGEVLVARPVFDLLAPWPWLVAGVAGGFVAVAGVAMWLVGASNRRVARRAGIPV